MRRWVAIVRATMLETLSEPLSLLLTMGAIAVTVIAPSFYFHQFGEPTRMARDAGLSAIVVFGFLHAVFCTVRTIRREIESGTAEMALAHPVSRTSFMTAEAFGSFCAILVFAVTVSCAVIVMVVGAEVGGFIAAVRGDIAFVWGPSVAINIAVILVSLVVAALLNRFARCRWTLSAVRLMLIASILAAFAAPLLGRAFSVANLSGIETDFSGLIDRLLPAFVAATIPLAVFTAASAAFAAVFRDNAASTFATVLFLLSLPFLSNYYLSDALAKGGSVSWGYVAVAFLAAVPFVVSFLLLAAFLFGTRDMGRE